MDVDQKTITIPSRSLAKPIAAGVLLLVLGAGLPAYFVIKRIYVGQPLTPTVCPSPDEQYRCRVTPIVGVYRKACEIEIEVKSQSGGWGRVTRERYVHEKRLPTGYSFTWIPNEEKGVWELTVYERRGEVELYEIDRWELMRHDKSNTSH